MTKFNKWRCFEDARLYVHSLNLKSEKEWRVFRKTNLPADIPTNPNRTYADKWAGMGDWLGTGRIADKDRIYLPYSAASFWAQQSGILTLAEWQKMAKEGRIPDNIPTNPNNTYRELWTSWGDFLSTGFIHYKNRIWRSYEDVREWARNSGIFTKDDWDTANINSQIPDDIPKLPNRVYVTEWKGWPSFFGRDIRGGSSAIEHIIQHELSHFIEIDEKIRIIENKRVDIVLKKVMVIIEYDGYHWHKQITQKDSFEHELFAGKGWRLIRIREKPLLPLSEDDLVVSPKMSIFERVCKLLLHLLSKGIIGDDKSSSIDSYIKKGTLFLSGKQISDLLGWREFSKAREWAQSLGLSSESAWRKFRSSDQLPPDVPSNPNLVYECDWKGWGDFLGSGNKYIPFGQWKSFEKAREWSRKSGIRQARQWTIANKNGQLPNDIPGSPYNVYSEQWISWNDWLGIGCEDGRRKAWVPFDEARIWAIASGIRTEQSWRKACKEGIIPNSIPWAPDRMYREKWQGWGYFFDNGQPQKHRKSTTV